MDLSQKLLAAFLAAFFLIALLRVFQAPLRIAQFPWARNG